ncbi:two-component sensor histidine kinase [Alcanivorax sp. N3-2A]|nr:two-component sensor histidine kinase [Alcanivorax sp. N3-2A]
MKRAWGVGLLWGLLAILASVPLWLTLPEPDARAITQAVRVEPHGEVPVNLPLVGRKAGGHEHYRLSFELDQVAPSYLFIPVASQQATFELAGQPVGNAEDRISMVGMASGTPVLIRLPLESLKVGRNVIEVSLRSVDLLPTGLSRAYVGGIEQLAVHYRVRVFVLEYLRFMVLAAQLLITLVVGVVWLYRPAEALFGWMFSLLLMSMVIYLGMVWELVPNFMAVMPYLVMAGSSASLILVITVLLIAGQPPPRWLKMATVAIPSVCVLLGLSGLVPAHRLVLLVSAPLNILSMLVASGIVAWAAFARRLHEAWLLVLPLSLMTITGLHDLLVLLGELSNPILLSMYYRPLMLIGIAMILMRRLGISLTRLDNVNGYLTDRLEQRERELACLHEADRRKAAQQVLSEERARLTADLHDGLSGHLASIIALSERENSRQVERAAREALDDLRLVVQSLDIDDRELPVALAGLRERLERQLKRTGIGLEWSMARLPEIAGVTPSHALNVLRIVQEAITNAIKHGQPTRILVSGDRQDDGRARIAVENDGVPFPRQADRGGSGLRNMRRRVRQLHGDIYIEPLESGTRLSLLLPLRLPEPTVAESQRPLTGTLL